MIQFVGIPHVEHNTDQSVFELRSRIAKFINSYSDEKDIYQMAFSRFMEDIWQSKITSFQNLNKDLVAITKRNLSSINETYKKKSESSNEEDYRLIYESAAYLSRTSRRVFEGIVQVASDLTEERSGFSVEHLFIDENAMEDSLRLLKGLPFKDVCQFISTVDRNHFKFFIAGLWVDFAFILLSTVEDRLINNDKLDLVNQLVIRWANIYGATAMSVGFLSTELDQNKVEAYLAKNNAG